MLKCEICDNSARRQNWWQRNLKGKIKYSWINLEYHIEWCNMGRDEILWKEFLLCERGRLGLSVWEYWWWWPVGAKTWEKGEILREGGVRVASQTATNEEGELRFGDRSSSRSITRPQPLQIYGQVGGYEWLDKRAERLYGECSLPPISRPNLFCLSTENFHPKPPLSSALPYSAGEDHLYQYFQHVYLVHTRAGK